MKIAPLPPDEEERLRTLRAYEILDTPPEAGFDELTRLAAEICRVPIAAVSLVDSERQWFKSIVGLDTAQTSRDIAFCAHTILQDDIMIVPDALQDPRFADNPLVRSDPGIRFYAGAPLRAQTGHKLGSLCVIDRVPRQLDEFQNRALRTLSRQVEVQLKLRLKLLELDRQQAELRAQRDALVQVQRQKEELTSLVVHDLKNPLVVMLLHASALQEQAESADTRTAAEVITVSCEAMNRMVMNLLDISRSEDGALALKLTDVDLGSLFGEIHKTMGRHARLQGQPLHVSVSPDVQAVRADGDLLRRVIENLIDNSLKYAQSGDSIQLDARRVDGKAIEIQVRDHGPGVPREFRERIFEKYAQLERDALSHARTSRGLGLTFCRIAVEGHGGQIWVEDNEPRGSRFVVRLPARA
jgi:signal transduction histidine kinase